MEKQLKPRRGRRPLPVGTAVRANTPFSSSQRVRDALIALADREDKPISHVILDALREKYPNDFAGL